MSTEIRTYLEQQEAEMRDLLKRMVLVQSGSRNKPGVDRVGKIVAELLPALGLELTTFPQPELGDVLVAATPAARPSGNILLIGHMDTVFPEDTKFNWYRETEDRIHGPGVADMKGGLVVGLFALKALAASGELDRIPLKFIFNSDEEIGSPASGPIIAAEARRSSAAFVLECGSLNDSAVTGRKGRIGYDIKVRGRAGHAAFAGPDKASAIVELARKVIDLESLNGRSPGLTVNVGTIQGGIGPNTVPEQASARVDVRYVTSAEKDLFLTEFERIINRADTPGCRIEAAAKRPRPPLEQTRGNRDLFRLVADQAKILGRPLMEEFRQGCSDGNIVADQGAPVLDGLGPLGDQDHSDREFIIKESLVQRSQLLALSLKEFWRRLGQGINLGGDIRQ